MTRTENTRRRPRIFRVLWIPALVAAVLGSSALAGLTPATAATRSGATAARSGATATSTTLTSYNGKRGWQLVVSMNGQNLTLYNFSKDQGKSTCYNTCEKTWYPLIDHGKIVVKGSHINAKQLKTVKRTDGSIQVTYYGQPLYRYHKDTKTGQMNGADKYQFGGSWGVMGVNGSALPPPGY